jgi:hypothetical protein
VRRGGRGTTLRSNAAAGKCTAAEAMQVATITAPKSMPAVTTRRAARR